ncbi:MAG: hypothetical protein HYV42_00485 [Candidatus Magasanikbacteria bacterium]|nr:hypothetical protein [Candidatus Magasanikbacteria bacterium]
MSPKTQKIILFLVFVALGLVLMQIPFTALVGAKARFTMFDFYGPIIGSFLGSIPGLLTVLLMQLINWGWHGFATDAATIIRFFPMLFAVVYFAKKSKWTLLVPAAAMIAFWAHPEGRLAWYFPVYWLIPIAAYFFHDKFIFARALGTTFAAHAVGGALWIWTFNTKAAVWLGGIFPVVWKERGLMALGITLAFLLLRYVRAALTARGWLSLKAAAAPPSIP